MRKYFTKLENNHHLTAGQEGHGYEGWLDTSYQPLDIVTNDPQLGSVVTGATVALSNETNTVVNLDTLVAGDAIPETIEVPNHAFSRVSSALSTSPILRRAVPINVQTSAMPFGV